ncbi:autotransporter strand-loop-strand O-heptosyltransferase [Bombella sp. TMW 2.2559]|uniref:Autotransporter strand-loop-strand O-heptosyltransferase n=1 Tax=Bombella dulcis TaxID=2967339 RepID=A0ABT3WCW5_9PROT|nr:autotransporter strand-loop-strand O-heptosyltransferase [Bombella dulcis]MCX5616533.1 autotransporter strand-loop-strand O-heptosyltransferase [Bombella dulcis]
MTEKKTERVLQDIVALKSVISSAGKEETGSDYEEVFSRESFDVVSSLDSGDGTSSVGDGVGRLPGFPFPAPAVAPTQEGEYGLRYDFNLGIRVQISDGEKWRLRLWDLQTDTCLYDGKVEGGYVCSRKKYFLRGLIELFDENGLVWTHEYDARDKKVAVLMPAGTLGDPLGWVPYAERFRLEHGCKITVVASDVIISLMESTYPDICFLSEKAYSEVVDEFYATYYVGLYFQDEGQEWQPRDFRMVGLHRTAGWILGVDPTECRPRVNIEREDVRPVEEPYVVVAVQASCACKMWQNPVGWLEIVKYLKKMGYRVVCIDKDPVVGNNIYWNHIPHGVEDETGERPLAERARWLKHAEFFIGLSSGLSWLAWAVGTPVIMISGFTEPMNEFFTPYRVFSNHGCNSCWHDIRTPFKHDDYLFCPHHKGTDKMFECTRNISVSYVLSTVKRLCRDYGYTPPAAGGVCPDSEEREESELLQGYERKHVAYWEL